jgi:6-pyruvoyltetrahydropterin/6-carboxytetrahydropterin synthase
MMSMFYEITITSGFSASHQLKLYDGKLEPLHGHNWTVVVTVGAPKLDSIGVVMDFHALERKLGKIIGPFHNRHLNELEAFAERNPSAEQVATHIAESLSLPSKVKLLCVEVWETPENRAKVRFDAE